jgi:hypothetical protein
MRCEHCDERFDEEEEIVENRYGRFHVDCWADVEEELDKIAADEDERLDDPRHGQAADINKVIK